MWPETKKPKSQVTPWGYLYYYYHWGSTYIIARTFISSVLPHAPCDTLYGVTRSTVRPMPAAC